MNVKNAVPNLEILNQANPSTMAKLINSATLFKRSKGEYLFTDREDVHNIYFLVTGRLSLHKISANGDKKILFLIEKGSVINEEVLYEQIGAADCEVLENSSLISFCSDKFLSIMHDDFELTKAVIGSLALKNRRLYRQLMNTPASIRGDKKIAAKLWRMSFSQNKHHGERDLGSDEAVIPMTITCLAEMIGSKRETVSRQVKTLSEKDLVHHKNGQFYIPSLNKLNEFYNSP